MNYTNQEIYLNSKYASIYVNGNTDLSDMIFYFSNPIKKPIGYNMRLKVSEFVFPMSFTLVDAYNNTLYVNNTKYTLINGNYNASTLKTMLLQILPAGFGITFDSTTNKFTFTYTAPFTFGSTSTCFVLLGFQEGLSYSSVSNSLTSNLVINLSGRVNMLYIDIPNITTHNLSSTTGKKCSVVKSIPLDLPNGSIKMYENQTDSYVYIQEDAIAFFHIRLLGENLQELIKFNGQHWNLTLEVGFVPNENSTKLSNMDFEQVYQAYIKNIMPDNKR